MLLLFLLLIILLLQLLHFLWGWLDVIISERGIPRTGYLIPVRDTLWDLPGWESCWDVAVVVAAAGVTLGCPDGFIQFEYNGYPYGFIQCTFFQKQVLKMNSREAATPEPSKKL